MRLAHRANAADSKGSPPQLGGHPTTQSFATRALDSPSATTITFLWRITHLS
jgi:hypothetical protein